MVRIPKIGRCFFELIVVSGGIFGWDRRNWTITSRSKTSVTYQHIDNADEGFPGVVTAFVSVHVDLRTL